MGQIDRLKSRFETLPRLGKNKVTQKKLAAQAGIGKAYLCEIFAGKKAPTSDIIDKLDAALDHFGAGKISQ